MVIPLYCDRGFLRRLLDALAKQTYRSFDVIIVNKPCPDPGKDPENTVKAFKEALKIDVVEQREGYFEEAINLGLDSLIDYDVGIYLDEDSVPLPNCVEEHVRFHEKHPDVGIVGGLNTYRLPERRINPILRAIRRLAYRPIHRALKGYLSYFASNGMYIYNPLPESFTVVKTLSVVGFNMSIKPNAVGGFRLPGALIRGLHNEAYLAMATVLNGYLAVMYSGALAEHREESAESLTRANRMATALETFLSPYILENYLKLKVNRTLLRATLWQLRIRHRGSIVYRLGSELALWALENRPSPGEVRARLRSYQEMLKSHK